MTPTPPIPKVFGFDHIVEGPGRPVLLMYGGAEYKAAQHNELSRTPFQVVALPERGSGNRKRFAPLFRKLKSRAVVIWPGPWASDRSRANRHAMMLAEAGASAVGLVETPPGTQWFNPRICAENALRKAHKLSLAGRAVAPWTDALDASAMFDEARALLSRVLDEPAATLDTLTLWCLHCWVMNEGGSNLLDLSPRLVFQANDARADHSRALRIAAWLTPSPLVVSRTIAAHLLPLIKSERPTLLLDDVGGGLLYRRDMRSLIAAGALRDGTFLGACTRRNPSGRLSCFAPAAIATTSVLPEDLRLRSIVVPMAPVSSAAIGPRLGVSEPPQEALRLRAQFQEFASDFVRAAPRANLAEPNSLDTAARETWAPLFTLAKHIGTDAAERALAAASTLTDAVPAPASNLALLSDIRDKVDAAEARIPTVELIDRLSADPERAWATVRRGRKIDARELAERLANFGLRPVSLKMADDVVVRGYRGEHLRLAFARHLNDPPQGSAMVAAQ
jgi:Protein of unknown function (DUF3631)